MFSVSVWISILICVVGVIALNFIIKPISEFHESIETSASLKTVRDAIRLQATYMQWSGWSTATKTEGKVEGPDGEVGCKLVYKYGGHELVELKDDLVAFDLVDLTSFGQKQRLTFRLRRNEDKTVVDLHGRTKMPKPWHLVIKFAGLPEWFNDMHKQDLQALAAFLDKSK